MARNYQQGLYEIKNPEKYKGNVKNCRYLSSWELEICRSFDLNPNVLEWSSEEVIIKYYSPADGKMRRYMVDYWVKYRDRQGAIHTEIIECKPHSQTQPPKATKGKRKKTLLQETYTWNVNQAKWQAATKYAKERGWKFRILTEKHIYS